MLYNLVWYINKLAIDDNFVVDPFDTEYIYNGSDITVSVSIGDTDLPDDIFVFEVIDGTLTAKNAGDYTATYAVTLNAAYANNYSFNRVEETVCWSIKKAAIDLQSPVWNYNAPFLYDGEVHTVLLGGFEAVLDYINVSEYYDNSHSEIGSYLASVTISLKDPDNYYFAGVGIGELQQSGAIAYTCAWRIERITLNVGKLEWATVADQVYDGIFL